MKRRMTAAAMFGTFIFGSGNLAVADECKQVKSDETMTCREIAERGLGPHKCLATERFGFRAVKTSADYDPWVTETKIHLGAFKFHPTNMGCDGGKPVGDSTLSIAKSGNGYRATLTGATNKQIDMTVARDHDNNELWLAGHEGAVNYFIYFRDKPGSGAAQAEAPPLPKFLVVEVLNFNNAACKAAAPSLDTGTVKAGSCESVPDDNTRESGVGGGGEGHGH